MTAVENYLKTLFNISEWDDAVRPTTARVAASLDVTASSVSGMVTKLVDLGLAEHERYGAIELTASGRTQAMSVVRRHRLIETYLVRALGYTWDEVHDEAEVLEHAVSALMVRRMDEALGHPWRDPHGDPIPTADGVLHQPVAVRLSERGEGETCYVARISDDDPDLLRYFSEHAISLDSAVTVAEQKPFGGATTVRIATDGKPISLDLGDEALDALWVTDDPPSSAGPDAGGCAYPHCRHDRAALTR